ncbi:MAG TPA: hypothetical protein VD887_11740 [Allosphingosinicella sp.]|nr:hypothetical protein [Allosphingosinicella sp.]
MLAMTILPVLALAAAAETPALARAVIDCTDQHAAMLASSARTAAGIADATVSLCSHTLDRLDTMSSQDPVEAERKRRTNAALREGIVAWMRDRAVSVAERERSRP